MFGGYSEVVAFIHEAEQAKQGSPLNHGNAVNVDLMATRVQSPTSAFGGFQTWIEPKTDFILIAECSEISGPSVIYTIPEEKNIKVNLNRLCIQLMSADYQEYSCSKAIPAVDTQVLMPDAMDGLHAAVNHFTVYDSEARGFVRPLCIAYITMDKHKLMQLSLSIFKSLSNASSLIQHSNRKFCIGGLRKLVKDLQLTKLNLPKYDPAEEDASVENKLKVYNDLIVSCLQDIFHILDSIQCLEAEDHIDELIGDFISALNEQLSPHCSLIVVFEEDLRCYEPKVLKLPIQQNFDKHLRNFCIICPGGSLASLYHLHLVYKHFSRKFENISLSTVDSPLGASNSNHFLHFGGCVNWHYESPAVEDRLKCHSVCSHFLRSIALTDSHYLSHIDADFCSIALDCLERQTTAKHQLFVKNCTEQSDTKVSSGDGGGKEKNNCSTEVNNHCDRHVVTLGKVWDVLDELISEIPEAESIVLKILQTSNWTSNILFSLLSHKLLVIIYPPDEEPFVRAFVSCLAILVPRRKTERVFLKHNCKKPLLLHDLKDTVLVTFCSKSPCSVSDLVPPDTMPAVLNLSKAMYTGPRYVGCLLNGVNERIKSMLIEEPIFPFLISILGEVEMQLKFWLSIVASSATNSVSTLYLLQRGFTKWDIAIIEKLTDLMPSLS